MSIELPALLGGQPAFDVTRRAGQWYVPPRAELTEQLRGIFSRQYYTEQGPLVRALEQRLAALLNFEHVVCIANASIAGLMLADVLDPSVPLLMPALATDCLMDAGAWTTHRRVVYDLDVGTLRADVMSLHAGAPEGRGSLFLVDWGMGVPSDTSGFSGAVIVDRTPGFDGKPRHGYDKVDAELISLRQDALLSAAEGGCVCTNDADLADRLRCMRASSGVERVLPVMRTVNGRMSEAQAALALLGLDHLEDIRRSNVERRALYLSGLSGVPGVTPLCDDKSASGQLICRIDAQRFGMDAVALRQVLRAENIDCSLPARPLLPQAEMRLRAPAAAALHASLLRLPAGSNMTPTCIERVCALLEAAHRHVGPLRNVLTDGCTVNDAACRPSPVLPVPPLHD